MPKSYQVGDTTYQFPDDFDDAKVQGILTAQGIIKAAEPPKQQDMGLGEKVGLALKTLGSYIDPRNLANVPEEIARWWNSKPNALKAAEALHAGVEAKKGVESSLTTNAPSYQGDNPFADATQGTAAVAIPVALDDIGRGAKAVGRGAKAVTSEVIDNPVARDLAGIVSPRLGKALDTAAAVREALKKRQAARAPNVTSEAPTTAEASVPEGTPVTTPPSEIESALQQSLDAVKAKQGAISRNIAQPEGAQSTTEAPVRTKGMGQALMDSRSMVNKLVKWGFSPDEARGMSEASWARLAHEANVPMPTTKAARARVALELQKQLAEPPRTVEEMLSVLRGNK